MTDEKMTDKTLANALAQQEAEYFQRHVDLTSKQYNLLLKLFQGAADSCLAEGRKRAAEESKEIIADLERKLAMRRNHICGPNTQSGVDEIDLITGKTEGREK